MCVVEHGYIPDDGIKVKGKSLKFNGIVLFLTLMLLLENAAFVYPFVTFNFKIFLWMDLSNLKCLHMLACYIDKVKLMLDTL